MTLNDVLCVRWQVDHGEIEGNDKDLNLKGELIYLVSMLILGTKRWSEPSKR
jgi:hypothetical protein